MRNLSSNMPFISEKPCWDQSIQILQGASLILLSYSELSSNIYRLSYCISALCGSGNRYGNRNILREPSLLKVWQLYIQSKANMEKRNPSICKHLRFMNRHLGPITPKHANYEPAMPSF